MTAAPSLDSRPRVGAGFRLQWEPAQSCHVLLYPEGMVRLNASAGEIMNRCDGQRDQQLDQAEAPVPGMGAGAVHGPKFRRMRPHGQQQ